MSWGGLGDFRMASDPGLGILCPFAVRIFRDEALQDTLCAHGIVQFEITVSEEDMRRFDGLNLWVFFDRFFESVDDAQIGFLLEIILGDVDFVVHKPCPDFTKLFFGNGYFFMIWKFANEIGECGRSLMRRLSVALPGIRQEKEIRRHQLIITIGRFIGGIGDFRMGRVGAYEILIAHGGGCIITGISVGVRDAEVGECRPPCGVWIGQFEDVEGFDGVFAASGFQGLYGETVVTLGLALRLPGKDRFLCRTAAAHKQKHQHEDYFCYT